MNSQLAGNLLAWSAQTCVLAAAASAAAAALKTAAMRLYFWQAVLALALLLPALEPRIEAAGVAGDVSIFTAPAIPRPDAADHAASAFRLEDALYVIAAGIALRLTWIAAGFVRLRRHRLAASRLEPAPAQAPGVRWYVSDELSGPVTFGWLRPSILLPASVNHLHPALRQAIFCHELIHVERRDWLFVIGEELVRAVLWFHPAIWWMLSRVHLAREQAVDAEVVRRTADRENYLQALVAVAAQKFSPAPSFLQKRQLSLRVTALLTEKFKEAKMSRVVARFAVVFSAALFAARVAVWLFPMQSPAQTPDRIARAGEGAAISVDPGAPLMHRAPIFRGLSTETGTVVVEATANAKGEVTDAHVLSGPEELRKPVLQSVLQWHYSTAGALPSPIRISVRFDAAPPAASSVSTGNQVTGLAPAAGATATSAILQSIEFVGVSPDVQQKVRGVLPVHEGDEVTSSSRAEILAAARGIDEHFNARMNFGPNHQATLALILGSPFVGQRVPPTAQPPQRIRVGGNVQAENLVQKVTPAYPPDAKAARIQGAVKLMATIGKDGKVTDLQLLYGHPLLAPAAIEAVKQWQYKPTLLNGNPVEVTTEIDVNFTLAQ